MPVARTLQVAGALALWASLYVCGALVCLWQLAGAPGAPPPMAFAAAGAIAAATYLLDRVKLADRLLDPADPVAHPTRAAIVRRRRGALRAAILILATLGAAAAWSLHPLAALLAPASLIGVTIYAGRPPAASRPRIKDRLLLKNLAVGASQTAFAAALLFAAEQPVSASSLPHIVPGAAFLLLIITADAALCDLDDLSADAQFGTRTLPNTLRRAPAIRWALAAEFVAGVALLACLPLLRRPVAGALWAILTPATALGITVLRPAGPVRDLIDARLILIAAVALAAG